MRVDTWARTLLRWNLILPVIALAAGGAAAAGAGHYVKARADLAEQQLRERYQATAVVVASRDVQRGQLLEGSVLAVRQMPRDFIPADALNPARAGELLGARAAIDIRRGTPVVPAALLASPVEESLAAQLMQGRRALTIQVDQMNSLAGQLRPGDTVDLIYSRSESAASKLVPLLERVQVLATGASTTLYDQDTDRPRERDFDSITLLVTSEEAARIVLAEQAGRITVLLRSAADVQPVQIGTRDSRDLLRGAGGASARAAGSPRVELLTGGHGSEPARSWLTIGRPLTSPGGALK